MVIAGLVLAGVGALVAGTAGPGEPSVVDDEVAVPSDGDGARATATEAGAAPPVVECRRAGGPFDCARWMRRPVGDADREEALAWATATTDRVLVAHGSTLTALDRATGRMQWEHGAGVDFVNLRVDGDVVVAQMSHGTTLGLSIHDGTMRWSADGTERLLERPTPGTVHTVRREDDKLVLTARNAEDGTARWHHGLIASDEPQFYGLVQIVPSEVVTLVLDEGDAALPSVVALDSETGTELWRRPASHPVHVTLDTTVVVDVNQGPDAPDDVSGPGSGPPTAMVGLDSADGTERWRQEVDSVFGGHVFRDDLVLFWSPPDGVRAFDLATGEERWHGVGLGFERPIRTLHTGSPPYGDPPVIVSFADQDDLVIGRDPDTGEPVWRTQPAERAEFITIVDGRIVAGQGGGSVTQLDPVTGQWLVTVSTVPTGRPWFVADDVLVDVESGWVAGVDLPQPQ